jgi:large repetitive protein
LLADNAPGSPQAVVLNGTGVAVPAAALAPSLLMFGTEDINVPSSPLRVRLSNDGTAALGGITIGLTGANAADFALSNNTCLSSLSAGSSCTVSVTFTPSATGARNATLQFADDAANSPQSVPLSGAGALAATTLQYIQAPPAAIAAGSSIGVLSVGVYTSQSMLVTSSSTSIQVTIAGPNAFFSSQTQTAVAGVASFDFTNVPLSVAGQYEVAAISVGLNSASAATMVAPQASAAQMNVTGFPSPAYSNVSYTFTVSVTDPFGNPITNYSGTVMLSSSDPSAVFAPATYTFVAADMGAHTFTAALVTLGSQSISATDGVLFGMESDIQVNAWPQFVVNTLMDDSGAALCDGNEACSLRSAINQANTLGAGDITMDTSQFSGTPPFTSVLMNGLLELSANINITGPGATQFLISGDDASTVLQVDAAAIATISGVTVTQGNSAGNGGGIANAGTLTLSSVAVTNSAAAASGGGIYNTGSLAVNSSTISANSAALNGGGVASGGTLTLYDSTISGNTAAGNGGGIDNSGTLSVPQSTLAMNAAADGAGIENEATGLLTLVQSTISANTATGETGRTLSNQNDADGSITILESIVAGNASPGGDCLNCGTQTSFNLFDVPAAALKLGPLASNGGPAQTMVPLLGSPAIGAGSVELAANPGVPQSLLFDQRGEGFSRVVNGSVDLGSVQSNAGPALSLALLVAASSVAGQSLSVTVSALTSADNPAGSFTDTVHFASSDPLAILPADYTFADADDGSRAFSITLESSGSQTITVTDLQNAVLTATQAVSDAPAAPSAITAAAGSGQSAAVSTTYTTALQAKVADAFGNPVPGVSVLFTAPASGASGSFANLGAAASVQTASNGLATAPAFVANATAGQFTVTATTGELTAAAFTLTNTQPPGYTVSANPTSLTITQGQSGSTTLTLTPVGGFSGTISLSCTGLPANADCTFAPSQAVLTGNNQPVMATLTVNTAATNGQLSRLLPVLRHAPGSGAHEKLLALLGAVLLAAPLGWRSSRMFRRRHIFAISAFFVIALAALGLAACGVTSSHSTQTQATAPGTYPIDVVAAVGNKSQTALVTITVVSD